MKRLISFHNDIGAGLGARAGVVLPSLSRFLFAAVLLGYFWNSARTKLGAGAFGLIFPSDGAYMQIFPRAMAAVSYDTAQLTTWHWGVAVLALWAEFTLPALIVAGLMTRLAAAAMIAFVAIQSLTDVFGHGVRDARTLGSWFDRDPGALILDQRALWVGLLAVIMIMGAGPLSLDRLLRRR
jgi:putative oxidoreductase